MYSFAVLSLYKSKVTTRLTDQTALCKKQWKSSKLKSSLIVYYTRENIPIFYMNKTGYNSLTDI